MSVPPRNAARRGPGRCLRNTFAKHERPSHERAFRRAGRRARPHSRRSLDRPDAGRSRRRRDQGREPEGDDTRRWGPPFIETDGERAAAYFHSCNRGKRGVVADFSSDTRTRDRATARRALRRSDREFQGRGVEEVRPRLRQPPARSIRASIYCSVTGFGQTGPYAERAGYDYLTQGMSGFMDITGEKDGPPQRAGVAISDLFTGLYGVVAIEAALIAREETGRGEHIDLALLDTTAAILANQAMNFLASGVAPGRTGTGIRTSRRIRRFLSRTAGSSSRSAMTASSAASARRSASKRWPATRVLRRTPHETRTARNLRANSPTATRGWRARGPARRAGKVRRAGRTDQHRSPTFSPIPQFIARGMRIDPQGTPGLRSPIVMSESALALERRSPTLGEHQAEVLREIGLDVPERPPP